ncbi:hypothetical protein J4408_02165 [Candidatus Pacearchaeota archaeon]|nr:hypothetical protein [Candidatus Pacearchaeota archaeon]
MSLDNIFKADNFFALTLDEARPELEKTLLSYLGIFPIVPGERPQTDGKRIMLEARKAAFKDSKKDIHQNRNMSLYKSDLLHELLHIREGTFLVDPRHYLEKLGNKTLGHTIFNVIDDARIEHNSQFYFRPEDTELLVKSNQYLTTKRSFPIATVERVVELFSSQMITKYLPSQFNPKIINLENETLQIRIFNPDLNARGIKTVQDLLREAVAISSKVYGESVEATWIAVPQVYNLLKEAFPDIEKEFPGKNPNYLAVQGLKNKESGKDVEGNKDNTGRENNQTVYLGYRGDVHDFSESENGGKLEKFLKDYIEKKDSEQKKDEDGQKVSGQISIPDKKSGKIESGLVKIISYDEMKQAYVHINNLQLIEYDKVRPDFARELLKYDFLRRQIVEHFQMLKPNELKRTRFSEDPDEINIEAVMEVLSDPSLRKNSRIYDSYSILERDSLTALLIDISGSTGSRLQSEKRVIDVERLSAGLIYQALTEIGDTVIPYAFSTDNEGTTTLYRLTSLENIGALEPESSNADGIAIRGVVSELSKIDAKEKNLIMISDGRPSASNYHSPYVDTSMAFGEAEAERIRTIYFNVDNQASDYFSILTRNTTFARSIRDVQQLPMEISNFVLEHA